MDRATFQVAAPPEILEVTDTPPCDHDNARERTGRADKNTVPQANAILSGRAPREVA